MRIVSTSDIGVVIAHHSVIAGTTKVPTLEIVNQPIHIIVYPIYRVGIVASQISY